MGSIKVDTVYESVRIFLLVILEPPLSLWISLSLTFVGRIFYLKADFEFCLLDKFLNLSYEHKLHDNSVSNIL